jgi:sigma-B regulation protein RsbU (phosphoserine phosphatase)
VIEVALGGHPQPLLLRSDGELSLVGTPNPLLGPYPEWEGATDAITLAPGDTLLLYSDGLTDARSGREFYGDDRLVSLARTLGGLAVENVVRRIESDVLDFAGMLNDDLAMLAVQRLPTPG